ncbi:hypothetical protein [Paraburkholderia sp. RL17-347-BIC-D]|uniref:hypothetical protein n=1 Tax=Paraburkholderia sp. RL17-347-BIC-D TaxID=3031632 RepID=UPI0038BD041C
MDKDKLTFALAYRLRFIDFLLAEYGTINRSAICSFFALSMPQASHDFATYQQIATHNMESDKTSKTYRRTREFERAFPKCAGSV